MKKLLLLGLILPWLGGCGAIIEAGGNVVRTSNVRPEVVQNQLADPFGTPFPGAYQNSPKTIVAERREAFYGPQDAYGNAYEITTTNNMPAKAKMGARFSDSQAYIREKWIRWGWIEGAPNPGVDFKIEQVTYEERRVILKELCDLYELGQYVTDCASIFEAMCRVESGCNQIAYNPEPMANARDGMGGSHGWFQIRVKVHNTSIECAYQFRCSAEWAIRYAIKNGLKEKPEKGQSWESARVENLVTALWRHNGAISKERRDEYLERFNTRLNEVNGKIIVPKNNG